MFFKIINNEIKFTDFSQQFPTFISISGVYCETNHCFIGPVTVKKSIHFNGHLILVEESKGTLDDRAPLQSCLFIGICSRSNFDKVTGLIERTEIGHIKKNNAFDISIISTFNAGILCSITINLPNPQTSEAYIECLEGIAAFKQYCQADIESALSNPLLDMQQRRILERIKAREVDTRQPSLDFSNDSLFSSIIEDGLGFQYGEKRLFKQLDQSNPQFLGCSDEQYFFFPPRENERVRLIKRQEIQSVDNSITLQNHELCTSEVHQLSAVLKSKKCSIQINHTTGEVYTLIENKSFYVNASQLIYERKLSYQDGTEENSTGYVCFETNYIGDEIVLSDDEAFKKSITKLRIIYLNNPVNARIVCVFKNKEYLQEIKMLPDFNDPRFEHQFLTLTLHLERDDILETTTYSKRFPSDKIFSLFQQSWFKEENVFIRSISHGQTESGNENQLTQTEYVALPSNKSIQYGEESFQSQGSLSPYFFKSTYRERKVDECPKKEEALSHDSSTEEDDDQMFEYPAFDVKDYVDPPAYAANLPIFLQDGNLTYNEFWDEGGFWEVEEEWDPPAPYLNKEWTDPLIAILSSRWKKEPNLLGLSKKYLLSMEHFFKDNAVDEVMNLVPAGLIQNYREQFVQKLILSQLAKIKKPSEGPSLFQRFSVLRYSDYFAFLDLRATTGKKWDAFRQPMDLIEMLRKAIVTDDSTATSMFKCSLGTMLLLMRLVFWVDLRLEQSGNLPSNSIEIAQFLKSNAFMQFFMSLSISDRWLNLSLASYSIKKAKLKTIEPTIEEQLAKVICHLISIPNTPINYFHYLLLFNDCGLTQKRGQLELSKKQMRGCYFNDLLKLHPLYQNLVTTVSCLDLQSMEPEKLLILSIILGQIAHDSIPKTVPNKYRYDNEYHKLINFRHTIMHGKSFSHKSLLQDGEVLDFTLELLKRMVVQEHVARSAPCR